VDVRDEHVDPDASIGQHLVQPVLLGTEHAAELLPLARHQAKLRNCTGGMNDARSSPARANVANHCASAMSVLRPGTALTCRALTTQATMPTASSAANGLFSRPPCSP